ncbi:restriction endonuclease [Photobacterium carnosum]|uniref:HNH endonuclease n=1 Tax=Photobacterium carnosum TaxID=2023717 RepID=UPI001E38AE7F|nr:restriction endonuclease [Photobacterium carnosum]MCD9545025.1 restriction endonuclease [Photobacterium carnosum]
MQLYIHDVGLKGSTTDFPKTINSNISIQKITEHVPDNLKQEVYETLITKFPNGFCNAWGVPLGASSVINKLAINDVILLIKTTGGDGEIPALCHVQGFWREPLLELSDFLWGNTHFPYVFFFKTEDIKLTWFQLKTDLGYKQNYRPSGQVSRVIESRLTDFGGVNAYVDMLRHGIERPSLKDIEEEENEQNNEYEEGERKTREYSYFKRNPKLAISAKKHYGYTCQACGFNFQSVYGDIGKEYIECHHLNPLSERDETFVSTLKDVCVLCANCHRMIHKKKPTISLDVLKSTINKGTEPASR